MAYFEADVGNCPVSIGIGNMVREKAGAYLVPHFHDAVVIGGVAGAVANNGGRLAIQEFVEFMDKNGPLEFGTVWPIRSYGGNADWHMNAITVWSGKDKAFDTIREATYRVMKACDENGIDRLILPALGTGAMRELTDEQSAKAMLAGIYQYASEGGKPVAAAFVFLDNEDAQPLLDAFKTSLQTKSYETSGTEKAAGEMDFGRWAARQEIDAIDNERAAHDEESRAKQSPPTMKPLRFKKQQP
ncbi:MAG: macro domain-containing protein [Alphaproteobacteria bacterium]